MILVLVLAPQPLWTLIRVRPLHGCRLLNHAGPSCLPLPPVVSCFPMLLHTCLPTFAASFFSLSPSTSTDPSSSPLHHSGLFRLAALLSSCSSPAPPRSRPPCPCPCLCPCLCPCPCPCSSRHLGALPACLPACRACQPFFSSGVFCLSSPPLFVFSTFVVNAGNKGCGRPLLWGPWALVV